MEVTVRSRCEWAREGFDLRKWRVGAGQRLSLDALTQRLREEHDLPAGTPLSISYCDGDGDWLVLLNDSHVSAAQIEAGRLGGKLDVRFGS